MFSWPTIGLPSPGQTALSVSTSIFRRPPAEQTLQNRQRRRGDWRMSLRHLPEAHRLDLFWFVRSFSTGTTPERAQDTALTTDVLRVVRLPRELNDTLLGVAARANTSPNSII